MRIDQFPFKNLYDWENRQKIGQGGFSEVYKVKDKKTGENVAIKQMDMQKFDQDFKLQALLDQISVMKELKNEHVLSLINSEVGKSYTYLVMQLCQNDLFKIMTQKRYFSQQQAIHIISDIALGYKGLVDKNYIHRDLKPQNILLKNKLYKIADFGFIKKVNIDIEKLRQVCGSPLYMAPQILYRKPYTSKCDVWSMGLIFYELLFGYSPWSTRHPQTYKRGIVNKEVAFPYNCGIGINVKDFIQKCLQLEESNRLSWKQVFNHPVISKKQPGPPLLHHQISKQVQKILIRVQTSSSRKFINVKELFRKYESELQIDRERFNYFLMDIDPQITSYQSHEIFQATDLSCDGKVILAQFKKLFLQVDYRPVHDIASRRVEQIVKMAEAKGLNVNQFFKIFDRNKSDDIDFEQFSSFIKYIAPTISKKQIDVMWNKFDKDKSNKICLKQFTEQMTRGTLSMQKVNFKNYQRAVRNIQCLRQYLKFHKVTPQTLLTDYETKKSISLQQFGKLVRTINYIISRDQIIEMFRLIDQNCSENIEINELYKLLG